MDRSFLSYRGMKTIYYPDQQLEKGDYAATIGFFDGVHVGHQFVIKHLLARASAHQMQSMVITFEHHPRQLLQSGWQSQLLTSLSEKAELLEKTGIDVLVVLRFDAAMASLTAREFMQQVLHDGLRVRLLLTGYDNRFGRNRSEGFHDYVAYGREMGIEVEHSFRVDTNDGRKISSTLLRQMIAEGDVVESRRYLGRCYSLTGTVVHGEQVGRQLGFPTANMELSDAARLVPPSGVYAVFVSMENDKMPYKGMMNIGTRPTFGLHQPTLEVNIFDFDGDIYGRRLTVSFVERLRSEQRFDTPEALAAQMRHDAEQARKLFTLNA